MTYTAFTYKVEEVETFGLFPNSADCSINFGFYIPENKSLVLRSKDKNQELKSYQKMDDLGNGLWDKKDKTQALVERRMVENNLQFTITDETEIKQWLSKYVENENVISKFIN